MLICYGKHGGLCQKQIGGMNVSSEYLVYSRNFTLYMHAAVVRAIERETFSKPQ